MAGNISEFNAGNLKLQPSQTGEESVVRSAYRIGAFGRQQAQAYDTEGRAIGGGIAAAGQAALKYEDHREISKGANDGSQMWLGLEQQWNNTVKTADPNDPRVAQRFRDDVLEPALEDFQDGFHTERSQEWSTRYVEQMRQHFFTKTSADMSTLAGIATHDNAMRTANTLATAVYADPSSLGTAFDTFDHSLDGLAGSSPTLSAADAAKIRETFGDEAKKQMVSAAVHGAIARGGDWHSIADNPKYSPYINAPEIQQFARVEKFYQRGAEVEAKQKLLLDKQIATQNMHDAVNDSWSKNVSVDPTGHVVIGSQFLRDMVNLPVAHHDAPDAVQTAKTYIDWTESQQKPAPVSDDHGAVDGLMTTIADPSVSLDQAKLAILKADTAHPMTARTRTDMLQLAADMRSVNDPFLARDMDAAKAIVEPKYGGQNLNPGGFAKFYFDFVHNQYLPLKMKGTLPPNALDMDDPKSLISQAIAKATPTLPAAVSANGGLGAPVPVYTAPKGTRAAPAKPPTITDKADYDKLAPGAAFVDQHGKLWTKPKGEPAGPTLQAGQT